MKKRIQSRAEIAKQLIDKREKRGDYLGKEEVAAIDMMLHLLADGKTVHVYEDRDMGGTVVEYEDK